MQHWLFKAKIPFIIGISCFILSLSLLACGGGSSNNGQQTPTDTPVAPFVTATPGETPTDTPVAPFVTATPGETPTDTPVAPFVTATPGETPIAPFITATPSLPTLTIDPSNLSPNSAACSPNGDGTYTCNVTLGETPQNYLSWSVTDNLGLRADPSSGQLTRDQPTQQVRLYSIPCQSDTFTFSGGGGSAIPLAWSCTP